MIMNRHLWGAQLGVEHLRVRNEPKVLPTKIIADAKPQPSQDNPAGFRDPLSKPWLCQLRGGGSAVQEADGGGK